MTSSPSLLNSALRRSIPTLCALALSAGCVESSDNARTTSVDPANAERFYDNEDGTVADSKTWLTWQQKVDDGLYTLEEAKSYCANLDLAGGGWKLPNLPELESIVDRAYFPTIDPIAFPDTPEEWAWTSSTTPYVNPANDVWIVSFANGASIDSDDADATFTVRCVR